MENNNINLLDLNNDILNIIGGYVKKDNERRILKEETFKFVDDRMKKFETNAGKNNRFITEKKQDFGVGDSLIAFIIVVLEQIIRLIIFVRLWNFTKNI
jgi:hypothetical protein